MPHYGDYQNAIYLAGLTGVSPKLPVDFASLEARAAAAMPPSVLGYVQGGCGDEYTQAENAHAFRRWGMVPRMMVDCSTRDLSVELFDHTYPSRLFMAPIGVTGLCTQGEDGDLAAARAATETGVPFCAATLSNHPLEQVAQAMGDTPVLFDSGIRSGTDVVKAIALGARMVGVGRPYLYGLALYGTAGCAHVLRSILAEADLMMAVDGWPTLAAVREAGAVRR